MEDYEIIILLSKCNQFPKHELVAMGFYPVDWKVDYLEKELEFST